MVIASETPFKLNWNPTIVSGDDGALFVSCSVSCNQLLNLEASSMQIINSFYRKNKNNQQTACNESTG
jgi:hypothetical protein